MTEGVYNGYPVTAQQKCLAHLRRHFQKLVKLGHGNTPKLGQAFLDLIDKPLPSIGIGEKPTTGALTKLGLVSLRSG